MTKPNSTILVICGPTASGKTSLALSIASSKLSPCPVKGRGGEGLVNILSVDSRQIYKGLDIVTGKDIPGDLPQNIRFFGVDLVEPNQSYNLADFISYSQKIIQSSITKNMPLIIVGGTGLYLKAITSDLLNVHVPPNQSLRLDLEKMDLPSLQSCLSKINPRKLASLNHSDLHNPRRLIRAIEIASSTHSPCPVKGRVGDGFVCEPTFHWIGIKQDKEVRKAAIRQRVLDRLDSGAIEEVENLMKKYPDPHLSIYTCLGVQEIIKFLHQEISRETLIDLWTTSEAEYARKQMVWFKKQLGIVWYDKDRVNQVLISSLARKLITCSKKNT